MGKKRRQLEEPPAEIKISQAPREVRPAFLAPAFLERYAGWIAIAAVLLASVRIIATYNVYSHTSDEPAHLACGLEWLDKGVYIWEPQHPPLSRVAASLGPYLLGAHSHQGNIHDPVAMLDEGVRILYSGNHYDLSLAVARLGILPFFWIACLVVFEWGRRYFNRAVAAMAVCVFTFTPMILAHAGLATTDMALVAFLGAAFLAGLQWLERPTTARAAFFGLCGGLVILSKFSCLVFFPAAAGLSFLWYLVSERPSAGLLAKAIRTRLPGLALSALICFFVIWAGYRFSFGSVTFTSMKLPFPELYAGIQQVQDHNARGHESYLLGQRGSKGWWYFFPVALAVKTPLALLLLLFVAIALLLRGKLKFPLAWLPLTYAAGILLVGMASSINIGLRHILPVYMAFALLAGAAICWTLEQARTQRWMGIVLALLLTWFAASSILSHPDYLPYFNELAGGHPEDILVDSDLDWGQDIKRLSKRLKELGAQQLTLVTPFRIDYQKAGLPPRLDVMDVLRPPAGWCAISVSYWKEFRLGLQDQYLQYTIWPDRIPPTEKIGKGIFLWYTPPGGSGN